MKFLVTILLSLALTSCSHASWRPTHVDPSFARTSQNVQSGEILSVQLVQIQNHRPTGQILGAGVGALGGVELAGGDRTAQVLGGIVGAIVGSAVGRAVDNNTGRLHGLELVVRVHNGGIISVIQQTDGRVRFYPGQPVYVITTNHRYSQRFSHGYNRYHRNQTVRVIPQ